MSEILMGQIVQIICIVFVFIAIFIFLLISYKNEIIKGQEVRKSMLEYNKKHLQLIEVQNQYLEMLVYEKKYPKEGE